MNNYEKLLEQSRKERLDVVDYKFKSERISGLYCDKTIALSTNLHTNAERNSVLSEELGHYHTTVGNILDQNNAGNRKQELRARLWAYNKSIGLMGIVKAFENGCCNHYEMAEYLEVTESFLSEALECYRSKYGLFATVDNYIVYFEPLGALRIDL